MHHVEVRKGRRAFADPLHPPFITAPTSMSTNHKGTLTVANNVAIDIQEARNKQL